MSESTTNPPTFDVHCNDYWKAFDKVKLPRTDYVQLAKVCDFMAEVVDDYRRSMYLTV